MAAAGRSPREPGVPVAKPLSLPGFDSMSRVIGLRALGHRAAPADYPASQRGCAGRRFAVEGVVRLLAVYA